MKPKSWCSPGQLVALMLAGWINRHLQAVIAYQREEIKGAVPFPLYFEGTGVSRYP